MIQRFEAFIETNALFSHSDTVLLAVSGGRDSVVLAHLMHSAGYHFGIAHCNFHLRPGDCDRDEAFVRQMAQTYQVPIHVAQYDTHAYAEEHHLSIEEAARDLRYGFFRQLVSENGYRCVATGHHRDDNAETFFINLLRGTGIAGLRGMRPSHDGIVRPLLPFGRDEIDAYVEQHHLSFVEDYTNASLDFRRNQVRHRLLPLLRDISPSIDTSLQSAMAHLAAVERVYRREVERLRRTLVLTEGQGRSMAISDIRTLDPADTILYELLSPYGFNADQVADMLSNLDRQSGREFLSGTHRLVFDRERILWQPLDTISEEVPTIVRQILAPSEVDSLKVSPDVALFDADRLQEPLSLRHPRKGDRFQPFGMKGASCLLSDYFKDHKFTAFQKSSQWLLVDASDRILWVAGCRASDHAKVAAETSHILRITLEVRG